MRNTLICTAAALALVAFATPAQSAGLSFDIDWSDVFSSAPVERVGRCDLTRIETVCEDVSQDGAASAPVAHKAGSAKPGKDKGKSEGKGNKGGKGKGKGKGYK